MSRLGQWGYTSIKSQSSFKETVGRHLHSGFETLDEYFSHSEKFERIHFNVESIDGFLDGGIDTRAITEIYGAASSGKTQLCLQLAFNCRLPLRQGGNDGIVLYITTDKPACARRLVQLDEAFRAKYGDDTDILGGIFISQFNETEEFEYFVTKRLPDFLIESDIKLLIIDSLAGIFRTNQNYINRAKTFCNLFQQLESLADKNNFAILTTNHLTAEISDLQAFGVEKASLGVTWSSLLTCRIKLEKLERKVDLTINNVREISKVRELKIDFSPRLPPRKTTFVITSRGIEDVP